MKKFLLRIKTVMGKNPFSAIRGLVAINFQDEFIRNKLKDIETALIKGNHFYLHSSF